MKKKALQKEISVMENLTSYCVGTLAPRKNLETFF